MQQREWSISEADAANDEGYFVLLGSQASAIPDAEYPWDPAIVRKIRAEFDPDFVPLFIRETWRTPAKTLISVGRHACGRTIRNPHAGHKYLNVLMPTTPVGGVRIKGPILRSCTFAIPPAHTPGEEQRLESLGIPASRKLSKYLPFDDRIYHDCMVIKHENESQRLQDRQKEVLGLHMDAQRGITEAELARRNAENRYALKSDWKRNRRADESGTEYDPGMVYIGNTQPEPPDAKERP